MNIYLSEVLQVSFGKYFMSFGSSDTNKDFLEKCRVPAEKRLYN